MENESLDLVMWPIRHEPITYKWVSKMKLLSNGALDEYKGRLVVRCLLCQFGMNFIETFSLVKTTTNRVVITLILFRG